MDTKQATCEERIHDHMEGREQYITKLDAIINGKASTFDEDYNPPEEMDEEAARERLDELPLGIELRRYVRITLSTGGPADYLDAELDADGRVQSVSYHFADWFDHAERVVPEDSALYRYAEYMAESAGIE